MVVEYEDVTADTPDKVGDLAALSRVPRADSDSARTNND